MARIKSVVTRLEIDQAIKAHNCQGNNNHRLQKDDFRLKIRNGRSWDNYCVKCAEKILKTGIDKLVKAKNSIYQKSACII